MTWLLRRLLGPGLLEVVMVIKAIHQAASSLAEYRQELAKAAKRGDLDLSFTRINKAASKAREYVNGE